MAFPLWLFDAIFRQISGRYYRNTCQKFGGKWRKNPLWKCHAYEISGPLGIGSETRAFWKKKSAGFVKIP